MSARYLGPGDDPRRYLIWPEALDAARGGAEGVLYKAIRTDDGREVALKRMVRLGPTDLNELRSTIDRVNAIGHRAIMHVDEVFVGCLPTLSDEIDDAPESDFDVVWMVSEWIPASLRDERATRGLRWRLGALAELADGVGALHFSGPETGADGLVLLHRDIKPGNVCVRADGSVVLVDFGSLGSPGSHPAGVGTRGWLAPEVSLSSPSSIASDVWGVGAVGLFLLTGLEPGTAASNERALRAALVGCSHARLLRRLLAKPLHSDPAKRPADLRKWAAKLRAAAPDDAPATHWRAAAVGVIAGALALAGVLLVTSRPGSRAVSARCATDSPAQEVAKPMSVAVSRLVEASQLCVRGGSDMDKMKVYDLFEPGAADRAGVVVDPPDASPMFLPDGWYGAWGASGFGHVLEILGYPSEVAWRSDGYWEVPLSVSGSLIAPSKESPGYWVPTQVRYLWDELGGAKGKLGLPMSYPYLLGTDLVQEFEGGTMRTAVLDPLPRPLPRDQVTIDLVSDEQARWEKAALGDVVGRIGGQHIPVGWVFDSLGRRRWVSTGSVWNCLGGDSVSIQQEIPGYVLAQFPLGPAADCPLDHKSTAVNTLAVSRIL